MRPAPRPWTTLLLALLTLSLASPVRADPTDCIVLELFYEGGAFDILADFYGGSYFVALTSDAPLSGVTLGAMITPALCKIEIDEIALGSGRIVPEDPPSVEDAKDGLPVLP